MMQTKFIRKDEWNPYQDENHGRQVIERVMEDEDMFVAFQELFGGGLMMDYLKATLPERMDAVVSIISK